MHTGLRKGELLGLTWEQVDFARGVVALGRRTKSGKGRDVPINSTVYAALVRAKILDPDVNFHALGHTFASHYVMRGGSLVKLQAILGHASIRTTQVLRAPGAGSPERRYGHPRRARRRVG